MHKTLFSLNQKKKKERETQDFKHLLHSKANKLFSNVKKTEQVNHLSPQQDKQNKTMVWSLNFLKT